ncbi:uncharacterized protein LOC103704214 [Phoenix dactylifera]|uniref:Uncharacterized protein LOC103704214 n=1 Tax=Phoenix dactylifera TaxID=42345 RepID=A0A8B7BUE8_PHODC|nr:uncharacterized protein LOC103704214 [Phoenix dactylifera]
MGRTSTRLPSFCLNRVATRVRVRSPPTDSKPNSATSEADQPPEPSANVEEPGGATKKEVEVGRRIMVVVDSSPEAKTALQWTLSHSVQCNDTIVLLDIVKPSKHGDQPQGERDPKGSELLYAMKNICQAKRAEVQVELSLVEGKERGPAIVEEARKQGASLLIMGQKKRSITWRLLMMWAGNKIGSSIVEYCVQNASCMALAVRRKSRRGGGYLITTKRHKDFWLLA